MSLTWGFSRIFLHLPWEEEGDEGLWGSDRPPWPCCFIILLTVVLKVLKYWTEHERWWPLSFPFSCCPFEVEDWKSHAAAAGLFRLTPRTITFVKEEEICVFTCDKCTLNTALSVLAAGLPADYVAHADQSRQCAFLDEVSCDAKGL